MQNKSKGLAPCWRVGVWVLAGLGHFTQSAHAAPKNADGEQKSPLARIEALNPHLVDAEIPNLSLKVASLSKDAYSFFRGTADLFYVWTREPCADWLGAKDQQVILHGDPHPGNTGTFAAHPDGGPRLAYALVDFDEAFEGPFELDLLRAMTSLRFAAAENGLSLSEDAWRGVAEKLVGGYRELWRDIPAKDTDSYRQLEALNRANDRVLNTPIVKRLLAKAEKDSVSEYVDKYTKGKPPTHFRKHRGKKNKIKDVMVRVTPKERDAVMAGFRAAVDRITRKNPESMLPVETEHEFGPDVRVLDVARWIRLGSSGSQGLRKYLVLIEPTHASDHCPRIFQLKEEPACAARRAGVYVPREETDRGQCVAMSGVWLQRRPQRFVSWTQVDGAHYLMKPKDPFGKEPDNDDLRTPEALADMAELMGRLLALGHAPAECLSDSTALHAAIMRDSLVGEIDSRSAACFDALSRDFAAFQKDDRVKAMTRKAEAWLAERE
ncbi:MAG TPA: DUF2252 family protein [Phycisphaerae bacterium]|nr:DUF2252 family protein [Phycisphaerae bacterium]HRW55704.1 DUF2252 family protein [Phycisphaerae bacterium]